MTTIYWLDDEPRGRQPAVDALRAASYRVEQITSEAKLVALLEGRQVPDLIIQDLHRVPSTAQVSWLPNRALASSHAAGWFLYRDVLKPAFPQVPVIICSMDAEKQLNQRQADDFNLLLLRKGPSIPRRIVEAVANALQSRRLVLSPLRAAPAVIALDFEKVNEALLRHLAKHPPDIHKVSWSNFETLVEVLLKELGYEVHHTPLTRDKGVDLWALKRDDLSEVLYAIDAKKYSPTHIVGPDSVRAIYAVADMAGANVGMIVTTSRFGPEARRLQDQFRHRLSLKDCEGVTRWIQTVAARYSG